MKDSCPSISTNKLYFMDLKKTLNLNTYEWWRNHRRVVAFGGFLVLFACYLSPVIQAAKNKNTCVDALTEINYARIEEELRKGEKKWNQPVSKKNWSRAFAFRSCNHSDKG